MRASCLAVLLALLLTGAAAKDRLRWLTAPSSSLTRGQAQDLACMLASVNYSKGWVAESIAATGSMLPIVDDNAFVVLEPVHALSELHVGDIIVFARDAATPNCMHRIIFIQDGHVLTEGDNNSRNDGWTPAKNIHYRVVAVIYGAQQ